MILMFKSLVQVAGHMRDGVFVSPHVRRADALAERAHSGQFRNSKPGAKRIPYIEHPRAVMRILQDQAGIKDYVTLSAALLHDTVEDCGITQQELADIFGPEVAGVVAELTNDPSVPREGKTAAQVAKASQMSQRASAVKIADKAANLLDLVQNPPDWDIERVRRYFDDAMLVVRAMPYWPENDVLIRVFLSAYAGRP